MIMKNIHKVLTLLIILSSVVGCSQNLNPICSNEISSSTSYQQALPLLWPYIYLRYIDRIIFLVVCPIILVFQILIILTYLKCQTLFQKPGDIFFGNIIAQTLINIHLFISAIYYSIFSSNESMPSSFPNFCTASSIIESFSAVVQILYLFFFLAYVVLILQTALNHKSKFLGWYMHLIIIIIGIIICVLQWKLQLTGLSNLGLCQTTVVRHAQYALGFLITSLVVAVLFIMVGIYSWCYFQKHMPNSTGLKKKRIRQSRLISIYIGGFSLFIILFVIASLIIYTSCFQRSKSSAVNIVASIFNVIRLVEMVFLICLLFTITQLRVKMLKIVRKFIQRVIFREKYEEQELQQHREEDIDENWLDQRLMQLKQQKNLIDIMKVAQILTIICGIRIAHKQYISSWENKSQIDEIKEIHYCETTTFEIGPKILSDYQIQTHLLPKVGVLEGQVTIYAPRIFANIIQREKLYKIYQSFDVLSNFGKLVSNLVEGDGGKSGQFFFFTTDHRYILKTINKDQYKFIKTHLQKFIQYFLNNPLSLITKIYGIYTIKNTKSTISHHLILMRNLSTCHRAMIRRTYDLKGSTHDREVLKNKYNYTETQLRKKTLKDTDFLNIQKSLHINSLLAISLRQVLLKDSKFLCSLNLIDYSLLIFKIQKGKEQDSNFEKQLKQKQQVNESSQNNQNMQNSNYIQLETQSIQKKKASSKNLHQIQRIEALDSSESYYHIGIIDYMQKWDLQKKSEKWWKTLLGKKDVSAEEPIRYQTRFMNFVDLITLYSVNHYTNVTQFAQMNNTEIN